MRETVDDLSFLREVCPEAGPRIEPVLTRLRESLRRGPEAESL
ncbi:hypothetical protein ACFQ6U_20955 [Streptomyces sp. NPDC056465]